MDSIKFTCTHFSWIILSLLIGTSYTSVYLSRLSSPGFTKLIDTIEDFVDNGEKLLGY